MSQAKLSQTQKTAAQANLTKTLVRSGLLQRKCACNGSGLNGDYDERRKKRLTLQRYSLSSSKRQEDERTVPPIVHDVLRSPGQPLDAGTRAFMEPRFGHDFSHVRVHADARAAESAQAVNALAYAVGHDVVFEANQYAPHSRDGQKLLTHELTHVVQQRHAASAPERITLGEPFDRFEREAETAGWQVAEGKPIVVRLSLAGTQVQRGLATEPPAEPAPAQPDLTEQQIQQAIAFNRAHYDATNTRLIQDLLGGPVTGTWTADNIIAIAATQEEYGLKKDGKVGADTFRFLNREQQLERMSTRTSECLTAFHVLQFPVQKAVTPGPGGTFNIRGHHKIEGQFSSRCNCSQFQYRQFIQGTATVTRGAIVQDISNMFSHIPGGQLPAAFREDGNTQWASPNFGHRDQAGQATTDAVNAENHYINDRNATDQANGCRYRGEDFPALTLGNLQSGDAVDLLVEFRGEIQRNGTAIQTRRWRDVDATVVTP